MTIPSVHQRYELKRQIGDGGMGEVWLAHDLVLARDVALKFLHPRGSRAEQARMRERFLREAQLAASVLHRNVVHTLDFGTTLDDEAYLVMEYLEGQTLEERLEEAPLSVAELVHVARLVMRGLRAVHEAGIVHRDLKPANILLIEDADGIFPKIFDFGISKSVHGGRSAVTTCEGLLVGTPQYMSPEQARGLATVDHRTDVYSMGVVLYEALSGERPFDSDNIGDLIVQVISDAPRPLASLRPELDPEIVQIVQRAMAHDPADRFQDASEMYDALHGYSKRVTHQPLLSTLPRRRDSLPTLDGREDLAGEQSGVRRSIAALPAVSSFEVRASAPTARGPVLATPAARVVAPRKASRRTMAAGAVLVLAAAVTGLVVTAAALRHRAAEASPSAAPASRLEPAVQAAEAPAGEPAMGERLAVVADERPVSARVDDAPAAPELAGERGAALEIPVVEPLVDPEDATSSGRAFRRMVQTARRRPRPRDLPRAARRSAPELLRDLDY